MSHLTQQIKDQARAIGFDVVGVAQVWSISSTYEVQGPKAPQPLSQLLLDTLTTWLIKGYQASMAWLARDPYRRSHPDLVLPGCQSIVMVGINYWPKDDMSDTPEVGRVARYAWGKDYHKIVAEKLRSLEHRMQELYPGESTRSYVDTGAIMEKPWAQQAGLGWIGKHTNLVSTEFGSWLLLGEVLTTAVLEPDAPGTDLCGSCTLCLHACPTGAIVEPYVVDAGRCISYLTIEYRGSWEDIPEDLRKRMGNKIFGCDDCLDICPFNVYSQPTREAGFQPLPFLEQLSLEGLLDMPKETFQDLTRESPIRRSKHDGFRRNVHIANHNRPKWHSSTPTQ